MRNWLILIPCFLMLACSQQPEAPAAAASPQATEGIASFTMRNREMREMILVESEKEKLEVWLNADGSIGYHVVDGDALDDIVNWVYAVYWVNN